MNYLSPNTAHKTLGYFTEPAGVQKVQFEKLLEKSDGITSFLWKTPLNRIEAWTYYTSCYLPSVCYPLTGSFLSQPQLDKIQRKAMSIIIPRCGYDRTTHRAIIYGPSIWEEHAFVISMSSKVYNKQCIFFNSGDLTLEWDASLNASLHGYSCQWRFSYPVPEYPSRPLPRMESLWIASMRQFLAITNTAIQLDDTCIPPLLREHDAYIMDMILNCNHDTRTEIRKLNYCCLHADIVLLSDCTSPCGTKFDMKKVDGQPTMSSSRNHHFSIWKWAWLLWCNLQGNMRKDCSTVTTKATSFCICMSR